jgi:hypothetical protein
MSTSDIMNHKYTWEEHLRGCEASYRRGVHQAMGFAFDLAEESDDRRDAMRRLARAEKIAGDLRFNRKDQGRGMLLHHIRQRLARGRRPAGETRRKRA